MNGFDPRTTTILLEPSHPAPDGKMMRMKMNKFLGVVSKFRPGDAGRSVHRGTSCEDLNPPPPRRTCETSQQASVETTDQSSQTDTQKNLRTDTTTPQMQKQSGIVLPFQRKPAASIECKYHHRQDSKRTDAKRPDSGGNLLMKTLNTLNPHILRQKNFSHVTRRAFPTKLAYFQLMHIDCISQVMTKLARAESGHEEILEKFEINIERDFAKNVLWNIGSSPHPHIEPDVRDSIYRVHRKDTKSDSSRQHDDRRRHERGTSKSRPRDESAGKTSRERVKFDKNESNISRNCPAKRRRERSRSATPSRKRARSSNTRESDRTSTNSSFSTSRQEKKSIKGKEKIHCEALISDAKRHKRVESAEKNREVHKNQRLIDPRLSRSHDSKVSVNSPLSHSSETTAKRTRSSEDLTSAAQNPSKSEVTECKHSLDILGIAPAKPVTGVASEEQSSTESVDDRVILPLIKAEITEGLIKGKQLKKTSEPLLAIVSGASARETDAKSSSKQAAIVTDTKISDQSGTKSSRIDAASKTPLTGERYLSHSLIGSEKTGKYRNEDTPKAERSQNADPPMHSKSAPITGASKELPSARKAHATTHHSPQPRYINPVNRRSKSQTSEPDHKSYTVRDDQEDDSRHIRETVRIEKDTQPATDPANICLPDRATIAAIPPCKRRPIRTDAATADCTQTCSSITDRTEDAKLMPQRTPERHSFPKIEDRLAHAHTPVENAPSRYKDEVESEPGYIKSVERSAEDGEIVAEEKELALEEGEIIMEGYERPGGENEIAVKGCEKTTKECLRAAGEIKITVEECKTAVGESQEIVEEGEIINEKGNDQVQPRASTLSKTSKKRSKNVLKEPTRNARHEPRRRAATTKSLDRYWAPTSKTGKKRHNRCSTLIHKQKERQKKKKCEENYSRISTQITTRRDRGSCDSYYSVDSSGESQYDRDVRDYFARAYTNRTISATGEPYQPPQYHNVPNYGGYTDFRNPLRYEGYY